MKPKVIILGHGYTSRLGVARSLGIAGYPVAVVALDASCRTPTSKGTKPADFYSKYVSEFFFCPIQSDTLVAFLIKQFAVKDSKPLLFPTSDFTAAAIDNNIDCLREHFVFPNINMKTGEVVRWMDKEKQKKRATECGLNVAEGSIISIKDGKFSIPETIKYPCFCKPLCTLVGAKHGLKKCNNKEELNDNLIFLSHKRKEIDVMVEEFLSIDKEFALVGFSDGKTVTIPGIFNIKEMAGGGHYGVARMGEIIPSNQFSNIIDKFKEYVRSLDFVGVFDIDFLLCQGKFYFDEMNMRFGGSGYAITKTGINLPQMMADYLIKGSYSGANAEVSKSASYVNDRMCLDDWYYGNITTKHMRQLLKEADITFIRDDDYDDDAPYNEFRKEVRKIAIKRIIRRIYKAIKK